MFTPASSNEVQQRVYIWEGETSGAFLVGYGGEAAANVLGMRDMGAGLCIREVETEELVMSD